MGCAPLAGAALERGVLPGPCSMVQPRCQGASAASAGGVLYGRWHPVPRFGNGVWTKMNENIGFAALACDFRILQILFVNPFAISWR